jgi:hypothetical protein
VLSKPTNPQPTKDTSPLARLCFYSTSLFACTSTPCPGVLARHPARARQRPANRLSHRLSLCRFCRAPCAPGISEPALLHFNSLAISRQALSPIPVPSHSLLASQEQRAPLPLPPLLSAVREARRCWRRAHVAYTTYPSPLSLRACRIHPGRSRSPLFARRSLLGVAPSATLSKLAGGRRVRAHQPPHQHPHLEALDFPHPAHLVPSRMETRGER